MKRKIDPRNLILVFSSTFFSLLVIEVFLRITFSTDQTFLLKEFYDRPFLVDNKFWKVWHYPSNEIQHSKDCFNVTYTSNSLGMRGPEVRLPKDTTKIRIALLGDSFIEGFGTNDISTLPFLLNEALGDDFEVLNFGASGGFGTVHQLSLYENFVTHFNSDYVLLFYLNYNDPYDNFKAIQEGLITENMKFQYLKGSLEQVLNEITDHSSPQKIGNTLNGLYTFNLANKGGRSMKAYLQSFINMKADFKESLNNVYSPEETKTLKVGYDITKKSISRIDSLVTSDGSRLIVIQFPDPYQIDKNWLSWSASKFETNLDPLQPNKRLKEICNDLDVEYYDMYNNAMNHIEKNNLSFPYFSQKCDRHPSEYGQKYFATELNNLIKDSL